MFKYIFFKINYLFVRNVSLLEDRNIKISQIIDSEKYISISPGEHL